MDTLVAVGAVLVGFVVVTSVIEFWYWYWRGFRRPVYAIFGR